MSDEDKVYEYRLKSVETKLADTLSSINTKLESIVTQQNSSLIQYALINQAVESLNSRMSALSDDIKKIETDFSKEIANTKTVSESKVTKLETEHKTELTALRNDIVAMKISQAERMGWGAAGGAVIAGVIELLKWVIGR